MTACDCCPAINQVRTGAAFAVIVIQVLVIIIGIVTAKVALQRGPILRAGTGNCTMKTVACKLKRTSRTLTFHLDQKTGAGHHEVQAVKPGIQIIRKSSGPSRDRTSARGHWASAPGFGLPGRPYLSVGGAVCEGNNGPCYEWED